MAIPQAGQPGHIGASAHVRRQPVRMLDEGPIDGDYTEVWEIICRACGDRDDLSYDEVSPALQAIRGPYGTREDARAALNGHLGLPADHP